MYVISLYTFLENEPDESMLAILPTTFKTKDDAIDHATSLIVKLCEKQNIGSLQNRAENDVLEVKFRPIRLNDDFIALKINAVNLIGLGAADFTTSDFGDRYVARIHYVNG